jgi:hypothetical protein
VVLFGCKTWSLTLREEHRLRVLDNRVLKRIFGTRRDEITGGWWGTAKEKIHKLYSSSSIIRMVKSRRILLVGMPEGKRSLGRTRCMWIDNIKMDLGDIKWGVMDCSGLVWMAFVNVIIRLQGL